MFACLTHLVPSWRAIISTLPKEFVKIHTAIRAITLPNPIERGRIASYLSLEGRRTSQTNKSEQDVLGHSRADVSTFRTINIPKQR